MDEEIAKKLRAAFPDTLIGKLPIVTCRACREANGRVCSDHSKQRCQDCGAYMTNAHIHLDYVGHAAVTDRLLEADPEWTWEPLAYTAEGTPAITVKNGMASLWARLTIGGVTRPAVGTAEAGKAEVDKELISDLIRNGAMRFGVALDLWSKEDLHIEDDGAPKGDPLSQTQRADNSGPPRGPDEEPTSKGNTRRGPRVLEGWADIAEQRAAHEAFEADASAQPDEVREQIKDWRKAQEYGYPMTRPELEATTSELHRLVNVHFGHCPSCGEPITDQNPAANDETVGACCAACAPM